MNLGVVIDSIVTGHLKSLSAICPDSITFVKTKPYYVEPVLKEVCSDSNSHFMVFSAPGATGKSILAQYISNLHNGIFWDLSKVILGDDTCSGSLSKAVGYDKFYDYLNNLAADKELLVIDAFDEAETISGRPMVKTFINDLINISENCSLPTVILFARTETALAVIECLKEQTVGFSHYEIGYIEEQNARMFIHDYIKNLKEDASDSLIKSYIDEQFKETRRLLNNDEGVTSFLGYAPVLEVLATAFDNESNTIRYLNRLKEGISDAEVIKNVMNVLFEREHNKVCNALKQRWEKEDTNEIDWDNVYTMKEQIIYILEHLIFNEIGNFYKNEEVPFVLKEDYDGVITGFLQQHPFIRCSVTTVSSSHREFTGPAFRDFSLAYLLADDDYADLVEAYFDEKDKLTTTSPILFKSYKDLTKMIKGSSAVFYLYNSFCSGKKATDIAHLKIYDDDVRNATYACFILERDNNEIEETEFELCNNNSKLYFSNLVDVDIDADYEIIIGDSNFKISRISNVSISCRKIEWNTGEFILDTDGTTGILIHTKETSSYLFGGNRIRHRVYNSNAADTIKIDIPGITNFSGLQPFKHDFHNELVDDFYSFARVTRSILDCLRSHSKDTPARKQDFIDNRIIGENESKRKVRDFLLEQNILYTDEQDWLYKLNTSLLSKFSLNWNEVRNGNLDSLQNLYNLFVGTNLTS